MSHSYSPDKMPIPLLHQGKVRDVYAMDENRLLIVATDRLSAFDVILPDEIPGKGAMLTTLSNFWFDKTTHIIDNHLLQKGIGDLNVTEALKAYLEPRSVIVMRLKALPVEAVVRGYLIGSGWKDYQREGKLCGIALPSGLSQAEQLSEPLFTPSTKAALGDHDENIDFAKVIELIGEDNANTIREVSLEIYRFASEYAAKRGIIIADTKFEFGLDLSGKVILMDEVLTPDSSRFWPAEHYRTGISPPSYDKQFVRDYLETLDWDKTPPGPKLPQEVIRNTAGIYREAIEKLTV